MAHVFIGFGAIVMRYNGPRVFHDVHFPKGKAMAGFVMGEEREYTEDEAREFWREIRAKVEAGKCSFASMCFPSDPDERWLRGVTFPDHADFRGAIFKAVDFTGATFGNADFSGAKFRGAIFEKAKFEGRVCFLEATFEEATLEGLSPLLKAKFEEATNFGGAAFENFTHFKDATFERHVFFSEAMFEGVANFVGAKFRRGASFPGGTFKGYASFLKTKFKELGDFCGATFEAAGFSDATFKRKAGFFRVTFRGDANFRGARFGGDIDSEKDTFEDATFEGNIDFREAKFERNITFKHAVANGNRVEVDRPQSLWDHGPFKRPGDGTAPYRFAKQAAQDRGDYPVAGDYHFAEECAIISRKWAEAWALWQETTWKPSAQETWKGKALYDILGAAISFLVGRLVFGYGEKPWRPVGWAFAVIFAWTAIYCMFGVESGCIEYVTQGPNGVSEIHTEPIVTRGLVPCLYFSIVTFTTLGYGDMSPPDNYLRLVAASEALLGAFLMALFVVSLARKFTR